MVFFSQNEKEILTNELKQNTINILVANEACFMLLQHSHSSTTDTQRVALIWEHLFWACYELLAHTSRSGQNCYNSNILC